MLHNEEPKELIQQGGMEYIEQQPNMHQEKLLGVHGRNDVLNGKVKWQERCRGYGDRKLQSRVVNNSTIGYNELKGKHELDRLQ